MTSDSSRFSNSFSVFICGDKDASTRKRKRVKRKQTELGDVSNESRRN
jgi:hypothetical protein